MPLARPIADALRRGATLVAASPRAARALRLAYAEEQRAAGRSVWSSPAICDWDSWLRDLWRDYAFDHPSAPLLLSPLQERALWTRVQREDAGLVLSPDLLAALAMEAWTRLSAYNAHSARRQPWEQTDAERFRHWAAEFERECGRHHWLSASQLASSLVRLLASDHGLVLPREILLVGFDRFTPAQQEFRQAIERRGVMVAEHRLIPGFAPEEAYREWIAAADQREEIAACAAWARDLLLARPAARIGIIAPNISGVRGNMERTFRRVLLPASDDIRQPSPPPPFEFSLGRSLADVPAIRAALLLLRWIATPLPSSHISWLLLSGFVADAIALQEPLARHDAALRRAGSLTPERSLEACRAALAGKTELRPLHDALSALLRTVAASGIRHEARQPSAWGELVHLLLSRAAWPGQRASDSVQFQALQRWQRLLDELALLDFDGTRCTYSDFIVLLERHAAETIFAPESHHAPIQIMGPLESSGQQFDAVWFLGADDASWPMHGRLHALLPPEVQRGFAMPHATPDDDWNLAHIVTVRLLAASPHTVFSYARRNKDAELRPSPLVAGLFPAGVEPQSPAALSATSGCNLQLEVVPDDSGSLPWPTLRTAGGAEVLKRQAACAFQSFATRRLAARPLEENERGLSPAEKGKLLHEVLQRLFSQPIPAPLHTRDNLANAIAANQLGHILDAHIEAVFHARRGPEAPGSEPPTPWRDAYLAAEKRRLRVRLTDWLTIEAGRQPFTVEACEQKLDDVHIGDLRLNLRADRIDLLADGTRLLIDYKTGIISPAAWRGERLAEPQLPLYAAYGNVENLSGILFAQIRAGETKFEGRIRDAQSQLLADAGSRTALVTDPYSDRMCDDWARALAGLAEEFLRGEAAVNPREPKVCSVCRLQGLCRVAENNFAFAGSNGDEEEESADA